MLAFGCEAPDHAFGLIVLDAFSSDSLPVHLLSREAIELYRSKLAAGACWHSTCRIGIWTWNRCWAGRRSTPDWTAGLLYDIDVSTEEKRSGKQPSIWAVMAEAERDLGAWRMILAGESRVAPGLGRLDRRFLRPRELHSLAASAN